MELWIPITLTAAFAQTIRTAIQRQMKGPLGDYGASAIRFIYAVPFAWLWFFIVFTNADDPFPMPSAISVGWLFVGGIAQIIFTVLLVKLFSYRNFLVGIAFSKTEVLFAAIFEAVILAAIINLQFGMAIFLGTLAVVILSFSGKSFSIGEFAIGLKSQSTLIGILCGIALAGSVLGFRAAINSLPEAGFLVRATTGAALAVVGQSILVCLYLFIYRRDELVAALRLWKVGLAAGFFAAISTACWFSAFALQLAAPVRAVGQAEIVFTIVITIFVFKQKISRLEVIGILLLLSSILLVIYN